MALSKLNNDSFGDTAVHGRRNLVINGAASVNQRGDSTGITAEGYYGPDRWYYKTEGEETVSISQASDGPDGFANSYKVEVTTTDGTIAADDYARVETRFEGQDLQQLKYGTSGAESITLSFYVKSSVTGTYAAAFYSADGVRAIGSTYTISSANTWEYKTLTFAGDTGGTINDDNTEALRVWFVLSAGSNFTSSDNTSWGAYSASKVAYGHTANVIGTSSATWQITGVQLEVGDKATPFEHRSFGEELSLCQRYFFMPSNDDRTMFALQGPVDAQVWWQFPFPTQMRSLPSFTVYGDNSKGQQGKALDGNNSDYETVDTTNYSTITVGKVLHTVGTQGANYSIKRAEFDAEL